MGNRAHVIFTSNPETSTDLEISPAVYLHWNGSAESVYPFLDELAARMGGRLGDVHYMTARFCQLVGEYFDLAGDTGRGGLSLGIANGPPDLTPDSLEYFDHGDNGVFVISASRGRFNVRRFSWQSDEVPCAEWDSVSVAREHKGIDPSYGGIAEFFESVRGPVSKFG